MVKKLDDNREYYQKIERDYTLPPETLKKKMLEWGHNSNNIFLECLDTEEKWIKCFQESTCLFRNQLKELLETVIANKEISLVVVSAGMANLIAAVLSSFLGKEISTFPNIFVISNYIVRNSLETIEQKEEQKKKFEIKNLIGVGNKAQVF